MPPALQLCGKMKMPELREALEARGLDSEGLKRELVSRLEEALATEEVADPAEDAPAMMKEDAEGDGSPEIALASADAAQETAEAAAPVPAPAAAAVAAAAAAAAAAVAAAAAAAAAPDEIDASDDGLGLSSSEDEATPQDATQSVRDAGLEDLGLSDSDEEDAGDRGLKKRPNSSSKNEPHHGWLSEVRGL